MRQVTPMIERVGTAATSLVGGIGLLAASCAVDNRPSHALSTAGWVFFMTGGGLFLLQALLHDRNYSRGHRDGWRLRHKVDSHLSIVPDEDRQRAQH